MSREQVGMFLGSDIGAWVLQQVSVDSVRRIATREARLGTPGLLAAASGDTAQDWEDRTRE